MMNCYLLTFERNHKLYSRHCLFYSAVCIVVSLDYLQKKDFFYFVALKTDIKILKLLVARTSELIIDYVSIKRSMICNSFDFEKKRISKFSDNPIIDRPCSTKAIIPN